MRLYHFTDLRCLDIEGTILKEGIKPGFEKQLITQPPHGVVGIAHAVSTAIARFVSILKLATGSALNACACCADCARLAKNRRNRLRRRVRHEPMICIECGRAARAVAAAGSRGEEEWTAVALEAPEQGASDGTAVVFRGFRVASGAYEPGVGGAMEPDFVGPFPDLAAARAWAIDGLDADAVVELVSLEPEAMSERT